MANKADIPSFVHASADTHQVDVTGRERMTWNVLASWAGHLVFVIAGFTLPRVIDRQIGQESLGVWDFCWSLVSYFGLCEVGFGHSVQRFVAKYRAVGDVDGLCQTVTTVLCAQIVAALVVLVLTVAAAWATSTVFHESLADLIVEARWVVLFLGAGMAVQLVGNPFDAVIVGCHRWDVHNGIKSGFYAITVTVMIVALLMGGGLRSLAMASFCGTTLTELTRTVVVFRICPELRIRREDARWSVLRQQLAFGGKTLVPKMAGLLLNQTTSIMVIIYLGPAALALYSRPRALVRHVHTLVGKFAFVLTPMASSLQATSQNTELAALILKTTRYGAIIALPMIVMLVIMGGPLLALWMGPNYDAGLLMATLAVGSAASIVQQPIYSILSGMNVHGRVGLAQLSASGCALLLVFLVLARTDLGLIGIAIAVTVPLIIVNGIYVPWYACRRLKLSPWQFALNTVRGPLVAILPYALCLTIARVIFHEQPVLALSCGGVIGGVVLAITYWHYALPTHLRSKISRRFRQLVGA